MINILFLTFILCCVAYLVIAPRKEVALFIIFHAFLQYILSLALWIFHMNTGLVSLLLGFMTTSTGLLLWARNMNYSREQHSFRRYFLLGQWGLLVVIVFFMAVRSPYYYLVPAASWHAHINPNLMSIHPLIKLSGNAFVFTTFFLIMLHWGQKWNIWRSLLVLGPFFLYLLIVVLLRLFQTSTYTYPFA